MLSDILARTMTERSMSARDVAAEIGFSHTTVLRALRGTLVDLDTLVALADWLGVRPAALLNTFSEKASLADELAVLVQSETGLEPILSEVVDAIKKGDASPEILADITAYISYRLGIAKNANSVNEDGDRVAKEN